jgi:hypothetical protein
MGATEKRRDSAGRVVVGFEAVSGVISGNQIWGCFYHFPAAFERSVEKFTT